MTIAQSEGTSSSPIGKSIIRFVLFNGAVNNRPLIPDNWHLIRHYPLSHSPFQTLNSQIIIEWYFVSKVQHSLFCISMRRDTQNQPCQIKMYLMNKVIVIPIVLALVLPVSWLASAHPLEVWHPLHSASICPHSLLHSCTALRQVTGLAPKYSSQAEIRGRVIEWQGFDQSPCTQTHAHTQEILMFLPSTWRYFVTVSIRWKAPTENPARMPPRLLGFLSRRWRWWADDGRDVSEKAPFLFHFFLSSLCGLFSPIAQHASPPHGEGLFVFVGRLPYWGQGV